MISGKVTNAVTTDSEGVKSLSILSDIPSQESDLGYLYFDFQLTAEGELFVVSGDQKWWAAEVRGAHMSNSKFRFELRSASEVESFDFETGPWSQLIESSVILWPTGFRLSPE
ncbi:hypothetical protein L5876_03580 [Hyphobacterium sp. SN044]|uniref:hypothetical protein n=1 Tax=Hyphobacterium sp. SN044 TaxID=2912575 RepID=UPI001F3CEE20|nr:hypothetical protein [Hyphobacterium sp. SN044]MCF8878893.1 hypothetical protein [Hyphobacterium sp. SN044]